MSALGLQHVVCRSAVDRDFLTQLRHTPVDAMAGFDLDDAERSLLLSIQPRTLFELAEAVEGWRTGAIPRGRIAVLGAPLVARAG
jgi:hypothetical protein